MDCQVPHHCNRSRQPSVRPLLSTDVVLYPYSFAHRLTRLQAACTAALSTMRMPTTRNEEYRFTDIAPLLQGTIYVRCALTTICDNIHLSIHPSYECAQAASPDAETVAAAAAIAEERASQGVVHLVLLDGQLQLQLSSGLDLLPDAMVYVGRVGDAPTQSVDTLVCNIWWCVGLCICCFGW